MSKKISHKPVEPVPSTELPAPNAAAESMASMIEGARRRNPRVRAREEQAGRRQALLKELNG